MEQVGGNKCRRNEGHHTELGGQVWFPLQWD